MACFPAIQVARLGRCRLRVDPVLFLALGYLVWFFGHRYRVLAGLAGYLPFEMSWSPSTWGLVAATAMVAGLLAHDLVYVIVARAAGARVHSITLSIVGGRIDVSSPGRTPSVEGRASAVAPLVLLLLGLVAYFLAGRVGIQNADLRLVLLDVARFHLVIGVFHYLPAFPLDGGRILRALTTRRLGAVQATRLPARIGKGLTLVCLALALVHHQAALLFVGVYLYAGSLAEEHSGTLARFAPGLRVADAMRRIPYAVSVHDVVGDVARLFTRFDTAALPVIATDGHPVAAIAIDDIRRIPPRARWVTTVGDLLTRLGGVVAEHASVHHVRGLMAERGAAAVAVVSKSGLLVGVLSFRRIDRKIDLATLTDTERVSWLELDRAPATGSTVPSRQPSNDQR